MHIKLKLAWEIDQQRLAPELMSLLNSIVEYGSLQQASQASAMSYRHAWGLLKDLEKTFNSPLVKQQRGRGGGSRLTPLGLAIKDAMQATEANLSRLLLEQSQHLSALIQNHATTAVIPLAPVKVFASSDVLLTQLSQALQSDYPGGFEFTTRGSIESLRQLGRNKCAIAGFHMPLGRLWHDARLLYKPWLEQSAHKLMIIATRRQGIILRDKKKVRHLRDLCKRSLSFINRQEDSGTRILFDELLKQHNISKKEINGYNKLEYTHHAVAELINSGDVDAGFGIETAAAKFKLHFIPLVKELYLLAFKQDTQEQHVMQIQSCLKSAQLQAAISDLVGYKTEEMSKLISIDELLQYQ